MIDVLLYQPEIPPNTGNVIRLCANSGARLHLIRPLGFELDDKRLRRAGLDYREWADMQVHDSYGDCMKSLGSPRVWAFSSKARRLHASASFERGDALLFGPETRGLPAEVLAAIPEEHRLRLPMRPESRSLNLSNSVAVAVYEAWRQLDFEGAV